MRIVNVSTVAELQSAINKSRDGDIICVPPGFTITGAIILSERKLSGEVAIVSALGAKGETR